MATVPDTPEDRRWRATLTEVEFSPITDSTSDAGTPSEDDTSGPHDYPPEDAQAVIGVSISRAQTRLASPRTPAAEKAAAMEEQGGGGLFDDQSDAAGNDTEEEGLMIRSSGKAHGLTPTTGPTPQKDMFALSATPAKPLRGDAHEPPSPRNLSDKRIARTDETRKGPRKSLAGTHKATSSATKVLPFNLPSIPKPLSLSNFSLPALSHDGSHDVKGSDERPKGNTPVFDAFRKSSKNLPAPLPLSNTRTRATTLQPSIHAPSLTTQHPEPSSTQPTLSVPVDSRGRSQIRRSASESSLLAQRTLSRASSLGDDSRFEHVQEQVNSRIKAVKDSLQDANFRLPRLPSMTSTIQGFMQSRNGMTSPSPLQLKERIPIVRKGLSTPPPDAVPRSATNSKLADTHPQLAKAMSQLEGDVVILGGYRGSILRSAKPPHRQLWIPLKVGLNLRKVDLEVGLNAEDDENAEEHVIPDGMLTHIGIVDISRRLIKRLKHCENAKLGKLRVHNYGYDWRLSPHLLSRKLQEFLEKLPCNQPGVPKEKRGAIVIAHSLGGLITRHAVNQNPSLFSGVIYAGTPQTCVNILGPFRNGDDVGLSSRVLTAQVNFTIRTSFALLPLNGKCFFNPKTGEEFDVDFFDPQTWIEYRLSPCIAPPLPPLHHTNSSSALSGLMSSMSSVLPDMLKRRASNPKRLGGPESPRLGTGRSDSDYSSRERETNIKSSQAVGHAEGGAAAAGMAPQMNTNNMTASAGGAAAPGGDMPGATNTNISTAVTIPRDQAIAYLKRVLAEVKQFKQELAYRPEIGRANLYPPAAVIYGKSTPTVYGAKVESREGIKHADAYNNLAFASGDGVVLAKASMLPEGYEVVRGGVVASQRGHVTLLGDLEAVGRCLNALLRARRQGVGMGVAEEGKKEGENGVA